MPERSDSYCDDEFVALGAGAALIGVSTKTLQRYAKKGVIEVHRTPSNQRRFRVRDLRALITPESQGRRRASRVVTGNRGWCAPIDPDAVADDEQLLEQIRGGSRPDGQLPELLAAWQDDCR